MNAEPLDPARAGGLLRESLSAVFAEMAFLDASFPASAGEGAAGDAPGTASGEPRFRAAIDALKPASLRLELGMTNSLIARIADTLLPDQPGSEGSHDAVLEIVNVVAGRFLIAYFGDGAEIKLELPRLLFGAAEEGGAELCSFVADVEGDRLTARLSSMRYRY